MPSLLDKVGTLISARLNSIVDQALQSNSVAVIDEYIRKVEDNLEALEDATATVGGDAKGLRRKQAEFQAKADELDRNIDVFLKEGKESLALAAQSRYNVMRDMAKSYADQAAQQEVEYQKLQEAKLKLEAKLTEVRQRKLQVQATIQLAKSKELTHKVVQGVAGATTAEQGISQVVDAAQRRLDKATTQSELDANRIDTQMDEALEQDAISHQLAERKSRLGLGGS